MTSGTIKRLTDRRFGFIREHGSGQEFFFHASAVLGSYDDLKEGQEVTFDIGPDHGKGPRAESVCAGEEAVKA